jgi:MoxR-like ATPase
MNAESTPSQQKSDKRFTFTDDIFDHPKLSSKPSEYIISPDLHRAVEVAMMLKQPLLLTGEPGTGKTRLAEKLAADLHDTRPSEYISKPLVFHTKTVSSYTDLFYFYDALSHFHDSHLGQSSIRPVPQDYIHLQALGQAIILSNRETAKPNFPYRMTDSVRREVFDSVLSYDEDHSRSSVVLIDEVDKAPRDFTNDLLNELDRYEFYVKEHYNAQYKKGFKNIVLILTSNSEKNLPEAFLRRCIFFNIPFPTDDHLMAIIKSQLYPSSDSEGGLPAKLLSFVEYFGDLRRDSTDKKPATAELISWINYLKTHIDAGKGLGDIDKDILSASFCVLAKDKGDLLRLNQSLQTV